MANETRTADQDDAATRIKAVLGQATKPMTCAQLAHDTGLSTSVVRHHIRAMRRAGVAYATPVVDHGGSRGRPSRTWAMRTPADPHLLAAITRELAAAVDTAGAPSDVQQRLKQLGAAVARETPSGRDPVISSLGRLGFSPRVIKRDGGRTTIELDSCPFFAPGHGVTDTSICRVHEAVSSGMVPTGTRVERLEIDPRAAGCRLHLQESDER